MMGKTPIERWRFAVTYYFIGHSFEYASRVGGELPNNDWTESESETLGVHRQDNAESSEGLAGG